MDSPLSLTPTRILILKALDEGNRYGREIIAATRGKVPSGQLYPQLRKLEEAGYIRARRESEEAARSDRGRIPRTYYKLTSIGEQALEGGLVYYGFSRDESPTLSELVGKLKDI